MSKETPLLPQFGYWADKISALFKGPMHCGRAFELIDLFRSICNFDHSVVFAYRGEEAPICIFDTFDPQQRKSFVTDYQAGPFLLDPFYNACYDNITQGLYGIRQLAPDHFFLSNYYLSYYRSMGLADELGFFIEIKPGIRIVMSLMRKGSRNRFDEESIQTLSILNSVVQTFFTNLWDQEFSHFDENKSNPEKSINQRLESCFQHFGQNQLTQREQQISQLLLRGHSSSSISKELKISPGTVKIHRKNIYAKLEISSHSELFSIFLDSLTAQV